MTKVVDLATYRNRDERDPVELATMSYSDVTEWAGRSFRRLRSVAGARDYRPEWIRHQLEKAGVQLPSEESATLDHMIANAGPFITRRQRWILRQLRERPQSVDSLIDLANRAVEYAEYKDVSARVRRDIDTMSELGLIAMESGKIIRVIEHGARRTSENR